MTTRFGSLPLLALVVGAPWWRCTLLSEPHDAPAPAAEAPAKAPALAPPHAAPPAAPALSPTERVPFAPPPPAPKPRRATLPDQVVVHALGTGEEQFLRCYHRAQKRDPLLASVKVTVHLELDPDGTVTSVTSDAEDPAFGACLGSVARALGFPAPQRLAAVDLPLFFR